MRHSPKNKMQPLIASSTRMQGPEQQALALCHTLSTTFDKFTHAITQNEPLPVTDILKQAGDVVRVSALVSTEQWLSAVRTHSSFTYRHIMIVTGFAAAFGWMYGMTDMDKKRLTLSALLHDIGKIKIPLSILDKPGKLSENELITMRRHPLKGYEILSKNPELGEEVQQVARSHHEFLDGSGYPDQLSASEIPDIVRVMTVIDIFSALIEARSYKASLPPNQAYQMLRDMGAKLDQDIVRAFKPIALGHSSSGLFDQLNRAVA